ncbi:transglutaminase family protein [Fibrobacter sp. UWB12]|uniref:transglutaminase family protein n=1 Tax=Fibrobacter sp. UWB12 TaxID=1896203 RepID=UPI00090FBF12|nr:transglutaminase family protein [Fibrobacter sp. UWB12]SHK27320.1 Transglutaminase-like superfamily protein [Fibrobacter sp. UWB12]
MLARFFWLLFLAAFVIALSLLLWSGRFDKMSYREMACVFEERAPSCLDSVSDWSKGLAFFDSSVAASRDTLGSLKKLLWEFWNIEFAGAGEAAIAKESVLPLRVLENRKSGCMGLSWLALMVAESRGLRLDAILLPGHVFLRYRFADSSVNLEPNRRGYSYTDAEYREKYKDGRWTGLEFKPLEARQFVGLAAFDIGNLYLETDIPRALTWYRMAEEFFPEYPGIDANQTIAKNRLPNPF